ncbi:MAG: hypothetical protein ACYDER_22255 [Ktedonobacteraceae bacterium]
MRNFSRFTAPGRLGMLALIASFLVFSSLASSAFAASTARNIQFSQDT